MATHHDGGNVQHPTLPGHSKTGTLFNCFYCGSDASIKNIQENITSPTDITEALTYAVGYIDQGATYSQAIQRDYKILEKRYQAATETISSDQKVLEKLKTQAEEQNSRVEELEDDLTMQKRLNDRLQRKITKLQTGQGADAESSQLMETSEKLQIAITRKEEYKEKYAAVQKKYTDAKSKLDKETEKNLDFKTENTRLETVLETQIQETLNEKKRSAQASADFVEAKHHLDVDGHIIAGIQYERELLKKTVDEKTQEVREVRKRCEEARRLLQAKFNETCSRLEVVEDEKKLLEEEHERCKAGSRAVEETPPTADEKSEEAKKNVVLKKPITIAGSIEVEGAPTQVDDKFFPIPTLDFDVTIFGHSSRNLFVTDNGMICFDQDIPEPRNKRHGQPLPHYTGVPPYTLFPFWTDLMIGEGEPHGMFYEISGEEGAKTLTVEWYVTHYEHLSNYYHFTVQLEEAKPNIVTFQYYDAVDEGENCTIGVQGKDSSMTFSYRIPSVYPGLRVVFDTKANTMKRGEFKLK